MITPGAPAARGRRTFLSGLVVSIQAAIGAAVAFVVGGAGLAPSFAAHRKSWQRATAVADLASDAPTPVTLRLIRQDGYRQVVERRVVYVQRLDGGAVRVLDSTCTIEECGEQPPESRIACVDGTSAGSTERCVRADDGSCGWELTDCAPPVECASNDDCSPFTFCDRSAVACNLGIRGMCSSRPTECPRYTDAADRRVCACDGLTYESACSAQVLGVSVAYDGPCE